MVKKNFWRHAVDLLLACLMLLMVGPDVGLGKTVKVGEPAPDFSVPLLDGHRAVRLSDFRGRRVLIFTWASW